MVGTRPAFFTLGYGAWCVMPSSRYPANPRTWLLIVWATNRTEASPKAMFTPPGCAEFNGRLVLELSQIPKLPQCPGALGSPCEGSEKWLIGYRSVAKLNVR